MSLSSRENDIFLIGTITPSIMLTKVFLAKVQVLLKCFIAERDPKQANKSENQRSTIEAEMMNAKTIIKIPRKRSNATPKKTSHTVNTNVTHPSAFHKPKYSVK